MQTYRRKRNDSHFKIVSFALVISWIVIGVGIWYVFFRNTSSTSPTNLIEKSTGTGVESTGENTLTHYYGEKILAEGTIQATENYMTFSHYLTTKTGEKFGIKSKDIDLYTFKDTDQVQIKGEVTDFKKELPIVNISEIVKSDGKEYGTKEIDKEIHGNPEYFLFKDEGIGFDLSVSEGYTIEEKGDKIVLMDLQSSTPTEILSISPFTCKAGDSLQDCDALKKRFQESKPETFVSSQGIIFYHLPETKTRVAFNDALHHGYYLASKDTNKFISFANLISFIDEGKIKQAVEKELKTLCKNIDYVLETADDLSYDWKDLGLVKVLAKGTAKDGTEMICKMGIKLGNSLSVEKISFNIEIGEDEPRSTARGEMEKLKKKNTEEKTGDQKDDEDEKEVKENTDEIAEKDAITPPTENDTDTYTDEDFGTGSGWFTYNSVRGYKVHFSSKNISYAGKILSTPIDFGMDGLRCPYKINVVPWKKADEVETNPALEIYECRGNVSETDLASAKLQKVGSIDGVLFLTKWYDNPWGKMEVVVRE